MASQMRKLVLPKHTRSADQQCADIAHKFMTTSGWDVGRVVKKCGALWAVKYPTDPQQYLHELNQQDYGHEGVWVAVKKGQG